MELHSIYRDNRIVHIELSKLSPMDLHRDQRFKIKVVPTMQTQGLHYPLSCVKFTPAQWDRQMRNHNEAHRLYQRPGIVNDDGVVWAVKMGCNRFEAAEYLGYTSIDVIFFQHTDTAVQWARWFEQCDPVNKPGCEEFSAKWDYI
jgi:hypothetical protein